MRIRPIALSLLAASCVTAPASGGGWSQPIVGPWGTRGAALEIAADGAVLHESCSEIALEPIRPDAQGRFTVAGRLIAYAPGPQNADVAPAATPVTVSGRIEGAVMVLSIAEPGGAARELRFQQGMRAKVIRCY